MVRRVRHALLHGCSGLFILFVLACGEQAPTRPMSESEALTAQGPASQAALEAQINGLINSLYAPRDQGVVKADFAQIKAQLASGRTTDAQASIVTFVQTLLGDLAGGDLQDPNGAQPPSTTDALASLVNSVAQFGGLPAPIPPSNPLGGDGAVAVVGPAGGTVVTETGFGGVQFPPGALPANVIVVVSRLPNPTTPATGPLPTTSDQYPLFYDFSTTPPVAQFAQPVLIGICQLEVGEPFGPPTQTVANRLQIAHPNPANPGTVELLAREPAPFVDCAGVALAEARQRRQGDGILARALGTIRDVGTRAVGVFRPTPAYAVHGGLGGKTTSFSPFGAVDPGAGSCPASARTGFATVTCFNFTSIPGVWHGFGIGTSIQPTPPATVGQLSTDYVLQSPTGFTRIPPGVPSDLNLAQYTFQSEFNGTTWLDVLRFITPANQPAQQLTVFVVKPMIVGVCATPMTGVAQTYATMDVALFNVAPGGTIKVCPQTIAVPGTIAGPPLTAGVTIGYAITKSVTIEAEIPSNKPQFIVNGSNVNLGFIVLGTPGRVTLRNLSFTLSNTATGAIDIGAVGGTPTPWNDVLVENNVFNLQSGIGRAVRVFNSTLPNPKITIQGNQMSGGTFPIVTLTASPTSTIEVLNNSFTGVVSNAGAQIQSEANVRVEGNTFSGGGCGGSGCIFLLNVSNALVRNNTMTLGFPSSMGIRFSLSNGTITQNSINGVGGGGSPSLETNYPMSIGGGIVIAPNSFSDVTALSSSTVLVTQNSVSNASAGIRVLGGASSVSGSNNVFSTVHSALRLDNTSATPSSLSISSSDFTTYFRPILFLGASPAPNTITATCNWWGNVLGPQNILAGTPTLSYSPWATAPVANGAGGTCPPAATFTISASPTALTIAPGTNSTSTVTIVRTNFTTDVALTLVGLPAGFTGTFTPATLTGTTLTSSLQVNVAGSVALGTYPITVQGVGGAITQTTTINITVGGTAIVYEFCNNNDPPLKFWRQSGGTWTEVPPTAGTGVTRFSFAISGSTGGIAYTSSVTAANVQNAMQTSNTRTSFGQLLNRQTRQKVVDARSRLTNQTAALTSPYFQTFVMFALTTEIETNRAICTTPNPPAPVNKTFTVSGMAANETGILGYGNVTTSLTPAIANYNVSVTPGTYDWLAAFGMSGTFPTNWTNYRLGRGETAAGGSVAINRTGAPTFVTMPFTITGGNPGSFYANTEVLTGANGLLFGLQVGDPATNTGNLLFLALNDRLATDMNYLSANNVELVSNVISSRGTNRYFGPNPPASATFALPQPVPAFTPTQVIGAPVTTWTVSGQIPTDFQTSTSLIEAVYTGAGESAVYAHVATRGWLTANNMSTSYTLTGPTLPGFLQQWAAAAPLFDATSAMFTNFLSVPTAGTTSNFSFRQVQNP